MQQLIAIIGIIFLLSSCQSNFNKEKISNHDHRYSKTHERSKTIPKKDGAPSGPPPSIFRRVIPKFEPFSHYGNPESYAVDGHTYDVLRTSTGYKSRGLASWYGTKFHSQRTSSGEDYDMYAMTAAHKTLPLPTYIRVKNLNNGKVAIVKVNDRGPFHTNRILDLSYAAASKLGILPKGTALVEIEALAVGGSKKKAPVARYFVQVGAYSSEKFAQALQVKLKKLSSAPVFVEKYQQHFIVKIGPLSNKNASQVLRTKLTKSGIKGAFTVLQ